MHGVILAPGPSLAALSEVPTCDFSVAINRAALRLGVSAWACCDLPAIEQWHPDVIGSPVLIAGMEAIDNLRDRKVVWRGEVFDRRVMLDYCPHALNWVMFSSTTALIYAAYKGATTIDVYGADNEGTADWDGTQAGKNRSIDRWTLERGLWRGLSEWLAEHGVTVNRHSPAMT